MFASPYLGANDMVVVLRPATSPTGQWFEEQVDVAADYRRAFGDPPENPAQLALEADTDNTHTSSRAEIAGLTFVPRSAVAEANQAAPTRASPLAPAPSSSRRV